MAENYGMSIYVDKCVVYLRHISFFSGDGKAEIKVGRKPRIRVREGFFKCHLPEYEARDSSTKGMSQTIKW